MTVLAHRTRSRDPDEQSPLVVVLKALLTVALVVALVAAALGAVTYVAARALVAMLS